MVWTLTPHCVFFKLIAPSHQAKRPVVRTKLVRAATSAAYWAVEVMADPDQQQPQVHTVILDACLLLSDVC